MTFAVSHTVSLTTDTGGDATGYTPPVNGRVLTVIYDKTDFATGVDFAITAEDTGQGIWTEADVNASATRAPRQPTHDDVGVASLYAAGGEPVEDHIYLADERVKIVVSNGGSTKSGSFTVIVG